MTQALESVIKDRVGQAVARLITSRIEGDRVRFSLPILYPSGNGCAVEVMVNGDRCFVSDFGFGQLESEMYGADEFYDSCARKSAERFGVGFDGASVFATWASLGRLEGAVAAVANASVQAAANSIMRAAEEKDSRRNVEIYDRIAHIFGKAHVIKVQELSGREATWPAHNVVDLRGRKKAIFEFVSANTNSIASKFLMFSDLNKMAGQYSLNSVVKSIPDIGNKGAMLADVSNVLQMDSSNDDFRRYAEAA